MTDELRRARPDAPVTILDGVGHYPMIESPAPLRRRRHRRPV